MNEASKASRLREPPVVEQIGSWGWTINLAVLRGLWMFCLAVLLAWLLFAERGVEVWLQALVVILLTLAIQAGQAWILVIAVQIVLFTEPRSPLMTVDPARWMWCLAALILTIYAARLRPLSAEGERGFGANLMALMLAREPQKQHGTPESSSTAASRLGQQLFQAMTSLAIAIAVTFSALLAMNYLSPSDATIQRWLRTSLEAQGVMWPGPSLFVAVIGLWLIVQELAWRQLTRAQAGVYLRSLLMCEYRHDLWRFIRRRMKMEKRHARRGSR